jgi:hypothetical protein
MVTVTSDPITDLHAVLVQLGSCGDEVADALRANRVQGVRNTARFLNPVVRYVKQALGYRELAADMITDSTLRLHIRGQEVQLPESVMQFLTAFNRGAYPDLELPEEIS